MSLTVGAGPFGQHPGGEFNFELPKRKGLIYFEDSPRRIRATFAGETIVDSTHAKLLHEHGHLPLYYFPESEVRMDLLEQTDHSTKCPWKGEASYWSIHVGERVSENAAWSYPQPIDGAPPLAGYLAFYWNKMDDWYEEDERMIVHARDPYHRVDVLASSRHVRVLVKGEVIAETSRPLALFETGLPTRWYFRPEDVHSDALVESSTHTGCAYKGIASYYSVRTGGEEHDDIVWHYPNPEPDMERIKGHLAFFNERVDIEVDGELQERPLTQWSRDARPAAPHA
jgi:uncharacterized protein (DUF427 family)